MMHYDAVSRMKTVVQDMVYAKNWLRNMSCYISFTTSANMQNLIG